MEWKRASKHIVAGAAFQVALMTYDGRLASAIASAVCVGTAVAAILFEW